MKHAPVLLTLVASLCAQVALADDAPSTRDAPAFEVTVVITDRGNAIFKDWDFSTGKTFGVDSIKIAPRGKVLSALVLFKGCKADASGTCNADVDIVAYDPSGKV